MRVSASAWLAVAVGVALLLAPETGQACSVCFSGREESRVAFLVTTILLSALPLVLIGSLVWWLRQRALQLQREERGGAAGS